MSGWAVERTEDLDHWDLRMAECSYVVAVGRAQESAADYLVNIVVALRLETERMVAAAVAAGESPVDIVVEDFVAAELLATG